MRVMLLREKIMTKQLNIVKFISIVAILLINLSAKAADPDQYFKLAPESSKTNPTVQNYFKSYCGKPVVVEFFSYACYGCFSAEEYFKSYLSEKPSKVEFKRVPVVFGSGWDKIAKMYYAYENLGVTEELHSLSFVWVQDQLKNRKPIDDESIENFLTEILKDNSLKAKLDAKNFKVADYMDILKSTTVNRDNNKGKRLFGAFQITSTPSVVVNNKYVITLEEAKNYGNLINAIKQLTNEDLAC